MKKIFTLVLFFCCFEGFCDLQKEFKQLKNGLKKHFQKLIKKKQMTARQTLAAYRLMLRTFDHKKKYFSRLIKKIEREKGTNRKSKKQALRQALIIEIMRDPVRCRGGLWARNQIILYLLRKRVRISLFLVL